MIFGIAPFTAIHVLLSLVGFASGLVVLFGLCTANPMNHWTLLFLATTLATCLTGFFLPMHRFTPALGAGILSMYVLAAAIAARYRFHLVGLWRWIYVICAVAALYLNSVVLVLQSFLKVPALHALAPNGSEPALVRVQGAVLVFFLITGFLAVKGFRPAGGLAAAPAAG
ncbi:MAG: hypothetical protein ACHQAR_02155 [Steroidobacterales bacterium]